QLLHLGLPGRPVPPAGIEHAVLECHPLNARLLEAHAQEVTDEAGAVIAVAHGDVGLECPADPAGADGGEAGRMMRLAVELLRHPHHERLDPEALWERGRDPQKELGAPPGANDRKTIGCHSISWIPMNNRGSL